MERPMANPMPLPCGLVVRRQKKSDPSSGVEPLRLSENKSRREFNLARGTYG